jgi:predicted glycosyltransferase
LNILFDIGHPAHVHLFRKLIKRLEKEHKVYISCRDKDITIPLLKAFGLTFISIGTTRKGVLGKLLGVFDFSWKLFSIMKKNKIDIVISHSSIYAAIAARVSCKYSITLEDTGNLEQLYLYRPFTNLILSPECLKADYGKKHFKYPSFHESAYLHQVVKKDTDIRAKLNLKQNESFVIIRFVARNASHDLTEKALSDEQKSKIVQEIKHFSRVFISSETSLPDSLKEYAFPLDYRDMHACIAEADLVFGESATMCSEAAFLGTPSVLLDKQGRDYTDDLEVKYQLVKNFIGEKYDADLALKTASDILQNADRSFYHHQSEKLKKEHIRLTDFLFWLIEKYPESINELKTEPGIYQNFFTY